MGTVEGLRVSVGCVWVKLPAVTDVSFSKTGATIVDVSDTLKCTDSAIRQAALALLNGDLVAFPTETVYGLGADAQNENAIARIYEVKGRPKNHPLIIHISSANNLDKWARKIPDYAIQLATVFWPGPMTLILPRTNLAKGFITGEQDLVGVRVPGQENALALLSEFEENGGLGVAAPSANMFGKVSPTSAKDVEEELSQRLSNRDLILDGGACKIGLESTIIDCSLKMPKVLRPGAITKKMIEEFTGLELITDQISWQIRASGLLKSHYSPNAEVFLAGTPRKGDGLIALSEIKTPIGVVRLTSPKDTTQYARMLYSALRLADQMRIKRIFVVPPNDDDLSIAINDRLAKIASS
jgi:L-threonylcarbamoyladenylate synthase